MRKLLMQNKAEEPATTARVSQLKAPRRQPALLKSVPWCWGISALQTSHPSLPAFLRSLLLSLADRPPFVPGGISCT